MTKDTQLKLKEILNNPNNKNLKPIDVAELMVADYTCGFEMGIHGSKVNRLLADKDFEKIYTNERKKDK